MKFTVKMWRQKDAQSKGHFESVDVEGISPDMSFLDLLDVFTGEAVFGAGAGSLSLLIGFVSAFLSGLFACKAMVALVRRAKLSWFALYCLVAAVLIFIIA